MPEHWLGWIREFFNHHGYWAVGLSLLLENAGVPVPGESILLVAGFLCYSHHQLYLPLVILVGTAAATLGDNLGYFIGHRGGRRLLTRYQRFFHVSPEHLARGERLFEKYGSVTVFFARFVFGMRIITGPLAGVLKMEWRRFVLFNFLGAAAWVTTIAGVGYVFGSQFKMLLRVIKGADLVILAVVVVVGLFIWWRKRQRRS